MEDEFSGKLTWDANTQWSGVITLTNGRTATFEVGGFEPVESLTEAARNTLKFLIANDSLIRHNIAVSMIEIFNAPGSWLDEDPITPEELAQKINLEHASIYDEGDGGLSYTADDDLFAGHWIQVPINANGDIGEPDLEG